MDKKDVSGELVPVANTLNLKSVFFSFIWFGVLWPSQHC